MLSNPTLVVEASVNQLFDDPKYPKVEINRGKRKQSDPEPSGSNGNGNDKGKGKEKRVKVDYESLERVVEDVNYQTYALVSESRITYSMVFLTGQFIMIGRAQPELPTRHQSLVSISTIHQKNKWVLIPSSGLAFVERSCNATGSTTQPTSTSAKPPPSQASTRSKKSPPHPLAKIDLKPTTSASAMNSKRRNKQCWKGSQSKTIRISSWLSKPPKSTHPSTRRRYRSQKAPASSVGVVSASSLSRR